MGLVCALVKLEIGFFDKFDNLAADCPESYIPYWKG